MHSCPLTITEPVMAVTELRIHAGLEIGKMEKSSILIQETKLSAKISEFCNPFTK